MLLSFIQEALGDQSRDILAVAADEVLVTLKNDKLSSREKKKDTEGFLGSLAEERFALLVNFLGHYVETNATRSGPWTQVWSHSNI